MTLVSATWGRNESSPTSICTEEDAEFDVESKTDFCALGLVSGRPCALAATLARERLRHAGTQGVTERWPRRTCVGERARRAMLLVCAARGGVQVLYISSYESGAGLMAVIGCPTVLLAQSLPRLPLTWRLALLCCATHDYAQVNTAIRAQAGFTALHNSCCCLCWLLRPLLCEP